MSFEIGRSFGKMNDGRIDVLNLEDANLKTESKVLKDKGIKSHNGVTAFFVRTFGSGIIDVKDKEGNVFHLNKKSVANWVNARENYLDTNFVTKEGKPVYQHGGTANAETPDGELVKRLKSDIHQTTLLLSRISGDRFKAAQTPADKERLKREQEQAEAGLRKQIDETYGGDQSTKVPGFDE